MSQFEKKSVNNGNLAIWLNSLKLGHLQTNRVKRPWGKKTTGYSTPQGKTKSTKTTSSGAGIIQLWRHYSRPGRVWLVVTSRLGTGNSRTFFYGAIALKVAKMYTFSTRFHPETFQKLFVTLLAKYVLQLFNMVGKKTK